MRELKFMGKRLDNGEWVVGFYIRNEHMGIVKHIIVTNWAQVYVNSFMVDPSTVGQYTGLKDSKRTDQYPEGQEIYEGDVIQMPHCKSEGYVIDEKGMWNSVVVCGKDGRWECHNGMGFRFAYGVVVIGNIYDNPELIKEDKPNER